MISSICTIENNSNLNFKGKIIDAHVHCGQWNYDKFLCKDVIDFFSKNFNNGKDYVDRVIISNLDCIKTGKSNMNNSIKWLRESIGLPVADVLRENFHSFFIYTKKMHIMF